MLSLSMMFYSINKKIALVSNICLISNDSRGFIRNFSWKDRCELLKQCSVCDLFIVQTGLQFQTSTEKGSIQKWSNCCLSWRKIYSFYSKCLTIYLVALNLFNVHGVNPLERNTKFSHSRRNLNIKKKKQIK